MLTSRPRAPSFTAACTAPAVGGLWTILLALSAEPEVAIIVAGTVLFLIWSVYVLLSGFTITVGARGAQVRLGVFGWPRMRFPLEGIRTARVEHLDLSDVGGWGFRTGLSWTAIMLLRGECLVLELESGRKFMVSVDDAAEAAALVNGLLIRTEAA